MPIGQRLMVEQDTPVAVPTEGCQGERLVTGSRWAPPAVVVGWIGTAAAPARCPRRFWFILWSGGTDRFQSPLVEPDMQISRIQLSDEIMPSPTESSPCVAQGA